MINLKFLIFTRFKSVYNTVTGIIDTVDTLPNTAVRYDDYSYIVHEQYAPVGELPIGEYFDGDEKDILLGNFTEAAIQNMQASEILSAIEADIAEGNV